MTKNNRKALFVDFNKPEYQLLSDEEVQLLKKAKLVGDEIKNCPKHGLHVPVLYREYDEASQETLFYGCPKCLKEEGVK